MSIINTCSIQLTESIKVTNGAHILYTYDQLDDYIANAVSFIITGVQQGQHIIFVDSKQRYERITERLRLIGFSDTLSNIKYVNSGDFYRVSDTFTSAKVIQNFINVVQPFLDNNMSIRTWGHVEWKGYPNFEEQVIAYESECDASVNQLGIVTVCAYSGQRLTASMNMRLMQSHQYVMTDKQFTLSSLYNVPGKTVIFPSLSEHTKIQSEMDLYKKKLDFVQVISHEVRNPLTVIKAYASMLLNEKESLQLNANASKKLEDIADYVTVIDNEIAHILNTEQMLTTEALWRTSDVIPLPIIQEVATMMEIKARTQNIQLNTEIALTGHEVMKSNVIGLRLIISNLLSNAVKYSFEGSEVYFKAAVIDFMLWIEIEDHGVGMTAEQQENLYRKYEKMNVDKSGQGIGLFMVKKLVELFNGEIYIDSEVGRGTIARVALPLTKSFSN
ncbi:MEDS domain-containing protein [Paenibacillus prosopidis]|uniref:histidine kinase n=1 Tax=Paenibacillus prosopidis TaxID=630520 RepID=A0A368W256_9BACL|nr:MEDS domain-containing protein [Paenibacillus prosopidis]RCW48002.1 phospho-acceptor domain-containing protein [Paenibacillus prosopidis]